MEPEISHRCPACGVAVRGTALFCPQCGRPVKVGETGTGGSTASAADAPARRKSDAGLNTSFIAPPANLAETMPGKEVLKSDAAAETRGPVGATVPLAREVEERSRRQRSGLTARDSAAEGRIAPRVEKLRNASSAVLEEASYDPGLRFVLVAVVIFLLSLLLLLLNHLLG